METGALKPETNSPRPDIQTLGLIAGNRTLPLLLAEQARKHGVQRLVAVAFTGETDPALAQFVDEIVWLKVGQLVKLIEAFKSRGVQHCVMAGQIAPRNLFDLRPDLRAMRLLLQLKEKNAQTIFGAVAEELGKAGVQLIEAIPWLRPLMPAEGFCLGASPTAEQIEDVTFGFRIAKEISRLEIGQTVVVKEGTVLAVEAFEGTDQCLARGGQLAGQHGGGVAVKVAKEKHDFRFDIPCIGPATVQTCANAGISVLALEPGCTLVLEQDQVEKLARKHHITVMTVGKPAG